MLYRFSEFAVGVSFIREPDLKEYVIFRTESKESARDIRLMDEIQTIQEGNPPELRPANLSWSDTPAAALTTFYYRIIAVDIEDNVSLPSKLILGRAFDYGPPPEPAWIRSEWIMLDEDRNEFPLNDPTPGLIPGVVCEFTINRSGIRCILQRMISSQWQSVTTWIDCVDYDSVTKLWIYRIYDTSADTSSDNRYRLKQMTSAGIIVDSGTEQDVPAINGG